MTFCQLVRHSSSAQRAALESRRIKSARQLASAQRRAAPGLEPATALARLRRKLGTGDEADRRFVRVLAAVLTDGLDAVEGAKRWRRVPPATR